MVLASVLSPLPLSGSGFIPLSEIIVPMNLTSLSLKRSLPALSLMDLWWQRSIKAMNLRSWSAWASSKLMPSPVIHKDVIGDTYYPIQAFQCRCQPHVKLVWRTGNTKWQTKPYLPYDVCMVVIHEDSSSRGM